MLAQEWQTKPPPPLQTREWRSGFLHAARRFRPGHPPHGSRPALARGNKKTGSSGAVFSAALVWNLPPVATCPGASAWCLNHCYCADPREDIYPIAEWLENWGWFEEDPHGLSRQILREISAAPRPVSVRIHSAGDFFSAEYIRFWGKILQVAGDAVFWAYTRSWVIPKLRDELAQLRRLPNVQLFASHDASMPPPPPGWRQSLVGANVADAETVAGKRPGYIVCRQLDGTVPNCAACGICQSMTSQSVVFCVH